MTAPVRTAASRTALLLTVGAVALGVAACHHGGRDGAVAVTTHLRCPDEQGDLRRTDRAPDGRSCRYQGPDGQEVTLAYLALDGRSPQDALRTTEADLRAAVPAAAAPEPGSLRPSSEDWSAGGDKLDKARQADEDKDDDADDDDKAALRAPAPPAAPGVPTPPRPPEPPQVDRAWNSGDHGSHERVRINLPFLHVDADGSGRARVHAFGVDVNADEDGATVRTPGGGNIDARHDGAEMRFGSVGRRRADLVYIVASDHAGPQGWRSGAYVAKGPAGGPLVLAVTRSRHDSQEPHDGDLRDVKRLVNANVRGFRGLDLDVD